MSTFLTWTSWAVPYKPSQTFTVITSPWFLLYASCLVNIAAEIHYLIFSLPVLLFSFRWVSVNNMWIIPVSCELLLGPSALPFFFPCTSLYDSAIRFEKIAPFSLWFAVILIKEKKQCTQRDELCAVEHCGSLCSVALVAVGLSHMEIKVNVNGDWGLWSLSDVHGVHCLGLTWSLLTLLASRERKCYCI